MSVRVFAAEQVAPHLKDTRTLTPHTSHTHTCILDALLYLWVMSSSMLRSMFTAPSLQFHHCRGGFLLSANACKFSSWCFGARAISLCKGIVGSRKEAAAVPSDQQLQ